MEKDRTLRNVLLLEKKRKIGGAFKDDCKGVEDFGKPENRRSFHFNP